MSACTTEPICDASWRAICVLDPAAPYLNRFAATWNPPPTVVTEAVSAIVVPPVIVCPTTAVVGLTIIFTRLVPALLTIEPQAMMLMPRFAISKHAAGIEKTARTLSTPVAPGEIPAAEIWILMLPSSPIALVELFASAPAVNAPLPKAAPTFAACCALKTILPIAVSSKLRTALAMADLLGLTAP